MKLSIFYAMFIYFLFLCNSAWAQEAVFESEVLSPVAEDHGQELEAKIEWLCQESPQIILSLPEGVPLVSSLYSAIAEAINDEYDICPDDLSLMKCTQILFIDALGATIGGFVDGTAAAFSSRQSWESFMYTEYTTDYPFNEVVLSSSEAIFNEICGDYSIYE